MLMMKIKLMMMLNNIVETQHEKQAPIEVEESVLEGDHGEGTIPTIQDEFQMIPPSAPV